MQQFFVLTHLVLGHGVIFWSFGARALTRMKLEWEKLPLFAPKENCLRVTERVLVQYFCMLDIILSPNLNNPPWQWTTRQCGTPSLSMAPIRSS